MTIETNSEQETRAFGEKLGRKALPGQVYALEGGLGAGKTVLTKGLAAGLGIEEPVSSPTFTILQIYEGGRLPLYHFDVYRIEDIDEMEEVGYDDYFYGEGICTVEWSDLIAALLPPDAIRIRIEKDPAKGFDYRMITVLSAADGREEQDKKL